MPVPMRRDGYGAPVPELTDARQAVLYDRPFNVQQRREILHQLEEQWRACLRKGTSVDVQLRFIVQDGIIQADVTWQTTRLYRTVREE